LKEKEQKLNRIKN